MRKIFVILLALVVVACGMKDYKDKVVARSDNLSSRPKWVKESQVQTVSGDYMYFIGQARIPAERANINMGYRMAENNAKNVIASIIDQNLTYIFQNVEEGTTIGSNQIHFVSTESAKMLASKVIPSDRYWEKVLTTINSNNDKEVMYLIFSRVKIKESDMKAAIDRTLSRNKGISNELKNKALIQWDNMVDEMKK